MRIPPRVRDIAELTIGYGLILVVIWTPNPAQRILYWMAFAWIAITAASRWKETAPNGLGLKGLLPSLWIVAAAIAIFFAGVALAKHLHTLHPLYGPLLIVRRSPAHVCVSPADRSFNFLSRGTGSDGRIACKCV